METSEFTILVVDDEELMRGFIHTFLSQLGYSCVVALDGMDALDKMKGNKIDAVITDIRMPKMDGILLTKEISARYPGVPVMVMTAFDEEYSAGTAISLGAREFIKKPFSPEEFAIRLSKMIGDSEMIKGMKNGKDTDKVAPESKDQSVPSGKAKSETQADKSIDKFMDDLLNPPKKS